jgi:hypothetical protein
MHLNWTRFNLETLPAALSQSHCLYAFHHPDDGDRPFYIGKAKHFGTKQAEGYKASARYNSGYLHLVVGMLRSGFSLYIAPIGEAAFPEAEAYEQELIALWNPVRVQKIKPKRAAVETVKPWEVVP